MVSFLLKIAQNTHNFEKNTKNLEMHYHGAIFEAFIFAVKQKHTKKKDEVKMVRR